MLKKVNFTGRVDLPMEVLEASVSVDGGRSTLFLEWNLSGFGFDPAAQIWLEIRRAGSYEYRREYLADFKKGLKSAMIDVTNMTDPLNLRLRLKVVLERDNKKLLIGNLDNFVPRVPEDQTNQRGFLKIIEDQALEVPWIMRYEAGEPTLVLSGRKNVYSVLKDQSHIFIPGILPEVVRQICIWAARDRDRENSELFEKWERLFIDLGAKESLFDPDLNEEEFEDTSYNDILDNAAICANEFSRRHSLLDQINSLYSVGEGGSNA
jgi:hypothetical protein